MQSEVYALLIDILYPSIIAIIVWVITHDIDVRRDIRNQQIKSCDFYIQTLAEIDNAATLLAASSRCGYNSDERPQMAPTYAQVPSDGFARAYAMTNVLAYDSYGSANDKVFEYLSSIISYLEYGRILQDAIAHEVRNFPAEPLKAYGIKADERAAANLGKRQRFSTNDFAKIRLARLCNLSNTAFSDYKSVYRALMAISSATKRVYSEDLEARYWDALLNDVKSKVEQSVAEHITSKVIAAHERLKANRSAAVTNGSVDGILINKLPMQLQTPQA